MRREWAERYGLLLRWYIGSAALVSLDILRCRFLLLQLAWRKLFQIVEFDAGHLLDG